MVYRLAVKRIPVVAAVIAREETVLDRGSRGARKLYLITQRRPNAVLPGLWEFPGGRREEGESNADALRREVRERLGAEVVVAEPVWSYVRHEYEHYAVDLYLYECELKTAEAELECRAVADYRWVTSEEFDRYPFTPADEASMRKLLGETE